jgi:hypothetical protein
MNRRLGVAWHDRDLSTIIEARGHDNEYLLAHNPNRSLVFDTA